MKRLLFLVCCFQLLSTHTFAQKPSDVFDNAQWIAMEADSVILFPHAHLLKETSHDGKKLKQYLLPVLSKSFRLRKKVERSWVNVCGLGQYELFINGRKATDHFLDPGWTMYNKRLYYNTIDVTDIMKQQQEKQLVELKVMLGGGMYDIPVKGYHKMAGSCGAPKLLLSMTIVYEDGKKQIVNTDKSWTAEENKTRYSSIYGGESYDATFSTEQHPVVITKPQWEVPIEKQDDRTRLKVAKVLPASLMPGTKDIYDTQQNCSGIVNIKVKGRRGQKITLRPSEILKDGKIYQRCMPGYTWTYTLSGDKTIEEWQPQFSYTGFRYIEVNADEGVEIESISALHTTTDTPVMGTFECSDTLLNSIYTLIDWAIRSNLASITTDCPTREKLGWQEQNHLMAFSMMYRYDMKALMNKITDDLADSQHEDGAIPTIAPEYVLFEKGSGFEDTPEWGASFVLCPYYTYLWYGDDSSIRKHYDAMKRYIDYLESRTRDGILDYGLGDWFDIGSKRPGKAQMTSVALSATAMYYYELIAMQKMAELLDKHADMAAYSDKAEMVRKAFNERFWNEKEGCFENGSQAASGMAVFMRLANQRSQQTVKHLVNDIHQRMKGCEPVMTAGDVGYRYVLQTLMQSGESELIWQMVHRDDIPGYAYQLKQGATALTESWQAYDNVSNNHLMLGHLMEWLFEAPGGIRLADNTVAWKKIIIAPQMVGDLTWAKTSVNTPQGTVSCHWTSNEDHSKWTIDIDVPEGTKADVCLPNGKIAYSVSGKRTFNATQQ